MKVDFLQSAVAVERRVQHIEQAGVPPGADGKRLERVAQLAHDPPDLPVEFRAFESVDGVQEIGVPRLSTIAHGSEVSAGVHAIDHGEDFLGAIVVDEVDRALSVEQRMARMKPEPNFVRGVEVP